MSYQRMTEWHLNDKVEEMRMRILGELPRCGMCTHFQAHRQSSKIWCDKHQYKPETKVKHLAEIGERYWCPKFTTQK